MQIEAGKTYRTRDGRKVGPMVESGDLDYPFTSNGDHLSYSSEGRFYVNAKKHGSNLIAEWVDEPTEGKPKWSEWMLRDFRQSWDSVEFAHECQVLEDENGDVVAYRTRKEPVTIEDDVEVFIPASYPGEGEKVNAKCTYTDGKLVKLFWEV